MLRIRFSRVGKRNASSFRLVLTPKESPPKGKFLEILGFYNPKTKERGVMRERVQEWLAKGAKPSDTAHNFLVGEGVVEGEKVPVHSRKPKKKTAEQETSNKTQDTNNTQAPSTNDQAEEAAAEPSADLTPAENPTSENQSPISDGEVDKE